MHWLEWHYNNVAYKVTTAILKTTYTKLETVFLPFPSCNVQILQLCCVTNDDGWITIVIHPAHWGIVELSFDLLLHPDKTLNIVSCTISIEQ